MASTVWRGYISFGLISIPVRLYRAARAERVSFRRLYRQSGEDKLHETEEEETPAAPAGAANAAAPVSLGPSLVRRSAAGPKLAPRDEGVLPEAASPAVYAPVQQAAVRHGTGEVVPSGSVVKGFEYAKDRYVVVDADELKSAAPKTSSALDIQEFVKLNEIDPVYFETSYYLTPEEAGEKAYALLYKSLQQTKLVAIAQFAMHSREHVVVVRSGRRGLLAHTMFYTSEVRADEEFHTNLNLVNEKELKLADTLVHSLAAPFEPEKYRDGYRERLEAMIASKVEGQPIAPEPALAKQADVVDIADALRRSLANLKKPAASDESPRETGKPEKAKSSSVQKSRRAGKA